ncbi:hypothetical protein GCM10025771_02720 [Niveibacterium umoris]|uniref:Shikimate kinase n=1 Tax=Niveibacterium umoris TaxID=1193620 RepID=A0A840BTP8_9RHOO|nr:hypothetical protein [Niveibacterium umoris]MBB4014186.1 hypothetical protein [Niveibacterium umoris]
MGRLIILTGAPNAGKTTVAGLLKAQCARLAVIEVDDLRACIAWMPLAEAVPLNLINACDVANNFLAHGLDVLFVYPLSDADFTFIRPRFEPDQEILSVALWCAPDVNAESRGSRVLSGWERERIRWMHGEGMARPRFAQLVDTTDISAQAAADTVKRICALASAAE